jgi:ABC-type sulfate transport system substrate-binding protein
MEQPKKQWKKKIEGNRALHTVKNPLRNFVERVLPSIQLQDFPDRPKESVNLSIGDPTTSPEYRYNSLKLERTPKI